MPRFLNLCIIFSAVFFSAGSFAKDNVAVINIDGVVANSDYAKSTRQKLENSDSFKQKRARYTSLGEELKKMESDAKANGLTWSDDQKKKHNQTAQVKLSEINQIGKQLEAEFGALNKKLAEELNPIIDKLVNKLIKDKKIDILLNARAAYFASKENDISKELLDLLNKEKK